MGNGKSPEAAAPAMSRRLWGALGCRRLIVGALVATAAVMLAGVAVRAVGLADVAHRCLPGGLASASGLYELVGAGDVLAAVVRRLVAGIGILALDLARLGVFAAFVRAVVRDADVFSRAQAGRLAAVGALLAAHALLGLAVPDLMMPSSPGGLAQIGPGAPELDVTALSLGLAFFALAGVFEYARTLQEDSDAIV